MPKFQPPSYSVSNVVLFLKKYTKYPNEKFQKCFVKLINTFFYTFFKDGNEYPEYSEYAEYPEYPDYCTTIRGPRPDKPCVFPFNFNGIEKTTCIKGRLRPDPWCSTNVDDSNNYIPGEWGYCGESCPNSGRYQVEHLTFIT